MSTNARLDEYRLLGSSGLRVSRLALGTMMFGAADRLGPDESEARRIFDEYVGRGGNFIDTANVYCGGRSEELVGRFAGEKRRRLIIATKCSLLTHPGDPNSCGGHRKNLVCAVNDSLVRLKTDYIDVLYLHAWDSTTPVEVVLRALDDLVRSGKILCTGISNTQAWQVSRMQAIAQLRNWSPFIALQIEYNLFERTVERELFPLAREINLGVTVWSPLKGGLLTGRYTQADLSATADRTPEVGSRRSQIVASGALSKRGLEIASVVKDVANELGRSPAQVALAWTLLNPSTTSAVFGARTLDQMLDDFGALEVRLSDPQCRKLLEVSAIDLGFPHELLQRPSMKKYMFGNLNVSQGDNFPTSSPRGEYKECIP
jgi:aryl-alcohol dehydrogenase-like predicted oxidoreductase